jgi:bifunctional N-acetylglucosamine-1-phosphate-uridyltransferase/glucosamine-1-phosphate-acetyltransferase GlmU-like protein
MTTFNEIIFKEKKFSDLLEEIYNNQKKKETQISTLINELKPLVKEIGDATLLVPLIKEYLDLGIKNDDQLIKVANIVQKSLNNKSQDSGNDVLTEEEKQFLIDLASEKKTK